MSNNNKTDATLSTKDVRCFICWEEEENPNTICVICLGCDIVMHGECENKLREMNARHYCLCPHCQRIGTLINC